MPFSWKNPLKALPVLLLLAAYAGAAFGVAGNVQFVIGDAKLITRAGVTRALQKGAEINEGDRIVTAADASAQIRMVDGGFIAIRPNTDMGFDTYRYSGKEDGTENALFSLLQGGFRTITGVIGRSNKQNYLVKTATATIGIRGTDHEPMVILAPRPGQVAIAEPGTYDKVNVGIAYIRNQAGSVDVYRNQVGFAPETKALPVVLPRIPPFYKPTPAPGPQKAAAAGEKAAEPAAQIRDTAVVDPTSTVTTAPAAAPVASAPVAVAPVVATTATDASGTTLNTTTQTQMTSTGVSTPIAQVAASNPVVLVANYGYSIGGGNSLNSGQTYWVDRAPAGLVTDAAGNLVSVAEDSTAMHGNGRALALSGGTANPATPIALAIGSAATATDGTVLLGWRAPTPSLSVSGIDFSGCFGTTGCTATARTVLGDGLSWVKGPAPFPDYLPGATVGTATYNLGASILHDQTGATGTVNSAGLTVNFTTASVGFNMAATTAAGNWTAAAPSIRMNQDGTFYAFSNSGVGSRTIASGTTVTPTDLHDNLSVTFSGGGFTWGNIAGQLMGIGLAGAGVTYDLNSSLSCITGNCPIVTASGALAFSNALPFSTLTPYQLVAFATGMNGAGQIDQAENSRIQGGFVSPSRVQTVNGFPVTMDGDLPVTVTFSSGCTINCGPFINDIPVVYTVAGASGPASIGTATLLESGSDPTTGISWGRYGAGTIGVNDRVSGASLGTLDATLQNVHLIMTAAQSGPTVLPITGTFNYTFAGGTTPTDSKGNVGTALAAANASLSANFSAQTVNATLSNLVVGGNTWGASATGIPIVGNVFQASKKLGGGGNLTVTSTLGTNTAGAMAGGFTGATGNGVGMLYSLNHGGNSATNPAAVTVSGTAAFRR